MLRLAKVENFRFEKRGEGRYTAGWEAGDRRYHVWHYPRDKGLDMELHSNPRVSSSRHSRGDHKALDFMSKRWFPMREDVLASITPEAIRAADKAYDEAETAKEEAEARVYHLKIIATLDAMSETLASPEGNVAVGFLRVVPRAELLLIVNALRRA